jgi:hypothetical protein
MGGRGVSWQEQRRLDQAAAAEQRRQDALAAAQVEQVRARARAETEQGHAAQRAELDRAHRAERAARRTEARSRRAARWVGLRAWAAAHVVDLMIYPLAVVSAVMAVPAMAAFGYDVYGTAAGYALPVITELGMWAFAFAVHLVRHRSERDGQDRPVWALQTGVWSFAAVAAGLNFVHGFTTPATTAATTPVTAPTGVVGDVLAGVVTVPPVAAGVVMAVASVAGVMAHQLVTAAPRRGRADRDAARIARRAAVKVARVRKAAVRSAVAEIDDDGGVRLVFTPGHYQLTRPRIAPWRWGRDARLASVALPGLPVTPATEEQWDDLDRELATLIATTDPHPGPTTPSAPPVPPVGGGIGTLDHDPRGPGRDPAGSAPIEPGSEAIDSPVDGPIDAPVTRSRPRKSASKSGPRSTSTPGRGSGRRVRSIEELRAELERAIEADPGAVDLGSAESIRRAVQCSPKRARELRDSYRDNEQDSGRGGAGGEADR